MRARKKGVVGLVIAIALMMVLLAGMLYFSYAGDSYNVDNALTGAAIGLEVENNLTKSTNSLEIIIDPISGGNVLGPDLENDPVIILPITNETSNNPLPLNDTIIVLPIVNETNNPDNNLNQSPVLDSNYTIIVPPEPAVNDTNLTIPFLRNDSNNSLPAKSEAEITIQAACGDTIVADTTQSADV